VGSRGALRLDHVLVPVHDAQEARRFYRDILGLPLVAALSGDDWGGHRWLMMVYALGADGQHLAAVAFEGLDREAACPYPRDARHHAVAVASVHEWQMFRARLSGAGVEFWEEAHGDQRSLYAVDPSGNVLEIATPETAAFEARAEAPDADADADADAIVDRWIQTASQRG
jgi:catechol 2,3-dioxygenase-like lactoylglutathione lyase family enzyme